MKMPSDGGPASFPPCSFTEKCTCTKHIIRVHIYEDEVGFIEGKMRPRLSQLRLELLPLSGITLVSRPVKGSSGFGVGDDLSMV